MEQFLRRTRALRWALALVLLLAGLVGGLVHLFETCEQTALESGEVKTVCHDPSVTDAAVVFAGILFLLLIAPDFDEAGLFGFSLKRRVEQQEKRQQSLEGQLNVLAAHIETVAAASATANFYFVTEAEVREARAAIPAKEAEFVAETAAAREGFSPGVPTPEGAVAPEAAEVAAPPGPGDAELMARLLAIWAELEMRLRLTVQPRRPGLTDLLRERFISIFDEELNVVHAARNAVAHARRLDRQILEDAVAIGERLVSIARTSLP